MYTAMATTGWVVRIDRKLSSLSSKMLEAAVPNTIQISDVVIDLAPNSLAIKANSSNAEDQRPSGQSNGMTGG